MGRNSVQIGIAEKFRVHSRDEMRGLVMDSNVAQALDTPHELTVRRRKIGSPSAAQPRATLAALQLSTLKIQARRARSPETASVYETGEIKLRRVLGFNLSRPGKHKESNRQNGTGYKTGVLHMKM